MSDNACLLGKMTVDPNGPVEVGRVGTWTFALTVGSAGIASGGGFRIMPPVTEPVNRYMLVRWQLNTLTVSGPEEAELSAAVFELNRGFYDGAHAQIAEVRNLGRSLVPGEVVKVIFHHAVASRFPMTEARFEVEIDSQGDGVYSCTETMLTRPQVADIASCRRLPDPPSLDVVPGEAVSLRLAALPCPEPGSGTRLTLSARDAFLNCAVAALGKVHLEVPGWVEEFELTEADRGRHTFQSVPVPRDGVHRLRAKLVERPVEGVSSPVAADFPMPVFFGDVHCHNWHDRTGTGADALFEHARDVAGLEFVAMTDTSSRKVANREAVRRFHDPGRFVTLFAEEWADGQTADHRNVYWRGDPGDYVVRAPHSFALFEALRGKEAIVVPHTTNIDCTIGWKHTDWSRHDPELQRLVEICQIRGDCEEEGPVGSRPKGGHGGAVRTALARGLRLGFVGGTDSHRQTAGGPGHELHPLVRQTGPTFWGQTAVLAAELTREAIFDALHARRCYATSGARILLWTDVNGAPMGSEIELAHGPITVAVRCHAEAIISELVVVRNGSTWQRLEPGRLDCCAEFVDETPLPGANYYYVRMTQADGHRAWASPVWVDITCK